MRDAVDNRGEQLVGYRRGLQGGPVDQRADQVRGGQGRVGRGVEFAGVDGERERGGEPLGRTARLLALMTKGDKPFNARDFAAVDAVHHPDMVAYVTGSAEPVYGRKAHAAAMQQIRPWRRPAR